MPRRYEPEDVYNIDDCWCPSCDIPLAKSNRGCPRCGRGRVYPVRTYLAVGSPPIGTVSDAFLCRVYIMGREDEKKSTPKRGRKR